MNEQRKVLKPESLYLGDNGRCLCGEHSGMMAQYTGRDISGQQVIEITPEVLRAEFGHYIPMCEQPRCGRTASLLFAVAVI